MTEILFTGYKTTTTEKKKKKKKIRPRLLPFDFIAYRVFTLVYLQLSVPVSYA